MTREGARGDMMLTAGSMILVYCCQGVGGVGEIWRLCVVFVVGVCGGYGSGWGGGGIGVGVGVVVMMGSEED